MLYKDTKAIHCSPDDDTDFFHSVTRVLQRYILAPFLSIICQDYLLQMSIDLIKENGFTHTHIYTHTHTHTRKGRV